MYTTKTFKEAYKTKNTIDFSKTQAVMEIIQTVQEKGDAALFEYAKRFDGADITELEVPQSVIKEAYDRLDADLRAALEEARDNITVYQESIKWQQSQAGELYQKIHPLNKVGIYVPGGKASYPSTVLMTAVLANVAGVKETIVVTPPQKTAINQATLAACYICGVTHV